MSEALKGVPCSDCFGTYDEHESGCRTGRLSILEAALRDADNLAEAIEEAKRWIRPLAVGTKGSIANMIHGSLATYLLSREKCK